MGFLSIIVVETTISFLSFFATHTMQHTLNSIGALDVPNDAAQSILWEGRSLGFFSSTPPLFSVTRRALLHSAVTAASPRPLVYPRNQTGNSRCFVHRHLHKWERSKRQKKTLARTLWSRNRGNRLKLPKTTSVHLEYVDSSIFRAKTTFPPAEAHNKRGVFRPHSRNLNHS